MSAPPTYDESVNDKNKSYGGTETQTGPSAPPLPYPSAQPSSYAPGYQPVNTEPPYQGPPPGTYQGPPAGFEPEFSAPRGSGNPDAEGGGFTTGRTFDDKDVRRMFIRKVYITLGLQLLVTFGIVCVFTFVEPVKVFIRANSAVYYAAYGVFLVLYIALICCTNVRRKYPLNIILLSVFTLAFSYMVGTIASFYKTQSVVIALGITVGVCIAVTLFSMQTKFDFTKCSGLLFVLVLVLMLFGFVTIFTYRYTWYIQVVYGALGALVFTLFLAFDTQLIMGGKRYELEPEEYIYGAITLYVDVVYIFIYILMLFGDH